MIQVTNTSSISCSHCTPNTADVVSMESLKKKKKIFHESCDAVCLIPPLHAVCMPRSFGQNDLLHEHKRLGKKEKKENESLGRGRTVQKEVRHSRRFPCCEAFDHQPESGEDDDDDVHDAFASSTFSVLLSSQTVCLHLDWRSNPLLSRLREKECNSAKKRETRAHTHVSSTDWSSRFSASCSLFWRRHSFCRQVDCSSHSLFWS